MKEMQNEKHETILVEAPCSVDTSRFRSIQGHLQVNKSISSEGEFELKKDLQRVALEIPAKHRQTSTNLHDCFTLLFNRDQC